MHKFKTVTVLILCFMVMSTSVYSEEIQANQNEIANAEDESSKLVIV